jgi:hypothetical protein
MEMQKLINWSFHRQKLDHAGSDILDVIQNVPGIYSSHPSGPLAIHARMVNFDPDEFKKMEQEKKYVRIPGLRGSVCILKTDEARKYRSAILPGPNDPEWARRYSESGRKIPAGKYLQWVEEILKFTDKPKKGDEISDACGIPRDIIKPVVNRMAYECRLLRVHDGSLRSNKLKYVNARLWAGWAGPMPSVDHSMLWLAIKYFRVFGPARMKDFFWWSGIAKSDFKWETKELGISEIENDVYLSNDLHIDYDNWDKKIKNIAVLPQWDPYMMGYAPDGRARFVDDEHLQKLYGKIGATAGNGEPCILIEGRSRAIWKSKFNGNTMEVQIFPFNKIKKPFVKEIESVFDQLSKIMRANKLNIHWN